MKYYNNTFYDASVDENLDESEMTVECRDTSADSGNQEVVTFCYVRHILQNTALHVVQARSPARLKKMRTKPLEVATMYTRLPSRYITNPIPGILVYCVEAGSLTPWLQPSAPDPTRLAP